MNLKNSFIGLLIIWSILGCDQVSTSFRVQFPSEVDSTTKSNPAETGIDVVKKGRQSFQYKVTNAILSPPAPNEKVDLKVVVDTTPSAISVLPSVNSGIIELLSTLQQKNLPVDLSIKTLNGINDGLNDYRRANFKQTSLADLISGGRWLLDLSRQIQSYSPLNLANTFVNSFDGSSTFEEVKAFLNSLNPHISEAEPVYAVVADNLNGDLYQNVPKQSGFSNRHTVIFTTEDPEAKYPGKTYQTTTLFRYSDINFAFDTGTALSETAYSRHFCVGNSPVPEEVQNGRFGAEVWLYKNLAGDTIGLSSLSNAQYHATQVITCIVSNGTVDGVPGYPVQVSGYTPGCSPVATSVGFVRTLTKDHINIVPVFGTQLTASPFESTVEGEVTKLSFTGCPPEFPNLSQKQNPYIVLAVAGGKTIDIQSSPNIWVEKKYVQEASASYIFVSDTCAGTPSELLEAIKRAPVSAFTPALSQASRNNLMALTYQGNYPNCMATPSVRLSDSSEVLRLERLLGTGTHYHTVSNDLAGCSGQIGETSKPESLKALAMQTGGIHMNICESNSFDRLFELLTSALSDRYYQAKVELPDGFISDPALINAIRVLFKEEVIPQEYYLFNLLSGELKIAEKYFQDNALSTTGNDAPNIQVQFPIPY